MVVQSLAGSVFAACWLTACAAPAWGQAVASAQISGAVVDSTGAAVPWRKDHSYTDRHAAAADDAQRLGWRVCTAESPGGILPARGAADGFKITSRLEFFWRSATTSPKRHAATLDRSSRKLRCRRTQPWWRPRQLPCRQVIDQRNVVDLPLNGRQATQLVMLSGRRERHRPSERHDVT